MKAIMITAPASGSGKTTITLGLIRALKQRGLDVCAYKTGPDYIDRAFLEQVSGLPAGNLDMHLQGSDGMLYSLSKAPAEYCIIEGVMGYFDGISNTYENSCYDIARKLKIPSLLVYSPKGEMFSAIPKIKGMADFPESGIKAVLFNNVTERTYTLLKDALLEYTNLECVGYVPKLENATFESRHLGLVQSVEIEDLNNRLDIIADTLVKTVDLDRIIALMATPAFDLSTFHLELPSSSITIAVAKDRAFSFYYRENLELLEACCKVVYFSPLKDRLLPDCDLVYFGGGYPEVFREELAANQSMLESVKEYGEAGGYIFGECGGLMYLTEYVEDSKMVGLLKGGCHLTRSLQRFGYINIVLQEDCFLGPKGTRLTGHEFHKSETSVELPTVYQVSKTMGDKQWTCGFKYKNIIAGYPHICFLQNIEVLKQIITTIEQVKQS
ncbi:cobyrinate a,c-diamide synthase [bacterium]|nr:cobyrinate a,c-diamide synthase [bacterium]